MSVSFIILVTALHIVGKVSIGIIYITIKVILYILKYNINHKAFKQVFFLTTI